MYVALKDFTDRDGVKIKEGQKLGKIIMTGRIHNDAVQMWNTVKDGRVTAVLSGSWSDKVGHK